MAYYIIWNTIEEHTQNTFCKHTACLCLHLCPLTKRNDKTKINRDGMSLLR